MKITVGTIEHITQLAIFRAAGRLSEADTVELFDSIDCLDLDELSELYGIAHVGRWLVVDQYEAAVADAKVSGFGAVGYLFGLGDLGMHLTAGMAQLKLS